MNAWLSDLLDRLLPIAAVSPPSYTFCPTVAIADCQHDNDNHHNSRDVAILRNLLEQSQTQAIVCIFFAVSVGATHVNHLMRTMAIRVSKN